MAEIYDYNTSAANNNSPAPDGFPEGMNYSQVNDAAREVMAVLARYVETLGGATMTGSNSAYAVDLTLAGAQTSGRLYILRANHTNTGPATLSINSQAPISLRNPLGTELVAGQILNGAVHLIIHDGTNFRVFGLVPTAGELRLLPGVNATETLAGIAAIATQTEADAGTDNTKIITPKTLAGRTAIATQTEVNAGTNATKLVTPQTLAGRTATQFRTGLTELATLEDVQAGTDNTKVVTPFTLTNSGIGQGFVRLKTIREDRRSTNTLATDNALNGLSLETGKYYALKIVLRGDIRFQADFQWRLMFSEDPVLPRGVLFSPSFNRSRTTAPVEVITPNSSTTYVHATNNNNFPPPPLVECTFQANTTSGGMLDFQWAPNNITTNPCIIYEGSYMVLSKLN